MEISSGIQANKLLLIALLVSAATAVPSFTGPSSRTAYIDEHPSSGAYVLTVHASDPDGGAFSFSLASSTVPFSIDSSTGDITVTDSNRVDRETNRNGIAFTVNLLDGTSAVVDTLQVTVMFNDINDNNPSWDNPITTPISIPENTGIGSVIFTLVVSDDDLGENADVRFQLSTPTDGTFSVNAQTGVVSLARSLDYDTTSSYSVLIVAQDQGSPPLSTNIAFSVSVTQVAVTNPAPFFIQTHYSVDVDEGDYRSAPVNLVTVRARDAADPSAIVQYRQITRGDSTDSLFMVSSAGGVSAVGQLDRETIDFFMINVAAYVVDGNGNTRSASATATVAITVEDINDNSPVLENPHPNPIALLETQPVGVVLYSPIVTDADSGTNRLITFQLVSPVNGPFVVNQLTGVITLARVLDYDVAQSYAINIRAQDGGTPAMSTTISLTVNVLDVLDPAPHFTQSTYRVEVAEGAYSMHTLLDVVAIDALHPDALINYTQVVRGDVTDGLFHVNSASEANPGRVTVTGTLDREAENTYTINIQAWRTNSAGEVRSAVSLVSVVIEVLDVNDNAPMIANSAPTTITLRETDPIGTIVYSLVVRDRDEGTNSEISFALTSPTDGTFAVSSLGVVTLQQRLNAALTSSYSVAITISDGGSPPNQVVDTRTVNVVVVLEPPVFGQLVYAVTQPEGDYSSEGGISLVTVSARTVSPYSVRYTKQTGSPIFSVSSTTGEVTLLGALDREAIRTHVITIQASIYDAMGNPISAAPVSTTTVVVTVADVNDNAPTFFTNSYVGSVSESAYVGAIAVAGIRAFDLDAGNNSVFLFGFADSAASVPFAVDPTTGVITVSGPLDYETTQQYSFMIKAQETRTTARMQSQTQVTVNIINDNDNLPMFASSSYTFEIAENSPPQALTSTNPAGLTMIQATDGDLGVPGQLTYQLLGNGVGTRFSVSSSGQISTLASLDHEDRAEYHLILVAEDGTVGASTPHRVTTSIIIRVTDVNDNAPILRPTSHTAFLSEGQTYNNFLIVQATDADPAGPNSQIQYSIAFSDGSTSSPMFTIDASTGGVSAVNLDYETSTSHSLVITARDAGTPQMSSTATLQVSVTPVNDLAPVFSSASYTASIAENLPVNSPIGVTVSATDPEPGHTVTYFTISSDTQSAFFHIDQTSGVITLAHSVDADPPNSHSSFSFRVIAVDDAAPPQTGTATISVTVTGVNDNTPIITNPPANDPLSYTIAEGDGTPVPRPLLTVVASDLDGDTITYAINPPSTFFTIDASTGDVMQTATLDYETSTAHSVRITACDPAANCDEVTLTISATDYNDNPPVFSSLAYTASVSECDIMDNQLLATVVATDLVDTGNFARVQYSEVAGDVARFDLNAQTGEIRVAPGLTWDYEVEPNSYMLEVRATDNPGGTPRLNAASDAMLTVTVTDCNDHPPILSQTSYAFTIPERTAGPSSDEAVFSGISVTDNDASASNRAMQFEVVGDVATATNNWFDIDSATGAIVLRQSAVLDREDPFVLINSLGQGVMSFDIRVTNTAPSATLTATAMVTVTILDINDHSPVFEQSDPIILTVVEHSQPPGSFLTDISATDEDFGTNAHIRYNITAGNDNDEFAIDAESGVMTVVGDLDEEHIDMYALTVQAENDQATGAPPVTITVIIMIEESNDHNPIFTAPQYTAQITEYDAILDVSSVQPGAAVGTVSASDQDGMSSPAGQVEYEIASGHILGDEQLFNITDPAIGVISVLRPDLIDYETNQQFDIVVIAHDLVLPENQRRQGTAHFILTVRDVNDNNPVFDDLEYFGTVPEEQPVGTAATLNSTISARDADRDGQDPLTYSLVSGSPFSLSSNGRTLTTTDRLDRETTDSYIAIINVQDSSGHSAQAVLYIDVGNINDNRPCFTQNSAQLATSLPENVPVYPDPLSMIVQTVQATDPDIDSNIMYYIGGGARGDFDVDPISGEVRVIDILDREEITQYNLNITATDGLLTCSITFTVDVDPVNDNNPVFDDPVYSASIPEDAAIGTIVPGLQFTATDLDPESQVVFEIVPGTSNSFEVTPQGFVVTNATLDRETRSLHTFSARATDGFFFSLEDAFIEITITDINDEYPMFDQDLYEVDVQELTPANAIILIVNAEDGDVGTNADIRYSISAVNPPASTGLFSINAMNGAIAPTTQIDIMDGDPTSINLTITATDQGPFALSSTATVAFSLVDRNIEAPFFNPPHYNFSVVENVAGAVIGRVLAMENNGDINTIISYGIVISAGDGSGQFSINSANGEITTAGTLDRETIDVYTITVLARDNAAIPKTGYASVTVHVLDGNDHSPVFDPALYPIAISESTSVGSTIVRVFASDNDIGTNAMLSYNITTGNASAFSIDDSGVITSQMVLDRESINNYTLIITASDGAPEPDTRTATANVTILINDENDNSPQFISGAVLSASPVEVYEDAEPLTLITRVQAVDPDFQLNGIVVYTFENLTLTKGPFQIDRESGEIQVRSGMEGRLDRETIPSYDLTVVANDQRGFGPQVRSTVGSFRINLLDVNDNIPTFTMPLYEFTLREDYYREDPGAMESPRPVFGQVEGTDRDIGSNAILYYHALGDGSTSVGNSNITCDNQFCVNLMTGDLILIGSLDRETQTSYIFNLAVSNNRILEFNDTTGAPEGANTGSVAVTVTDYNDETPEFIPSTLSASVAEEAPFGTTITTLRATDADIGNNSIVYFRILSNNVPYVVDRDSGVVTTAGVFTGLSGTIHNVEVEAFDNFGIPPTNRRTGIVTVRIYKLTDQVIITFKTEKDLVERKLGRIQSVLEQVTEGDVTITEVRVEQTEDGSVDTTGTDVLFFTVQPVNNEVISPHTVIRLIDAQYTVVEDVFTDCNVQKIAVFVPDVAVAREIPYWVWIILGVLGLIIICLCCCFLIGCVIERRRNRRWRKQSTLHKSNTSELEQFSLYNYQKQNPAYISPNVDWPDLTTSEVTSVSTIDQPNPLYASQEIELDMPPEETDVETTSRVSGLSGLSSESQEFRMEMYNDDASLEGPGDMSSTENLVGPSHKRTSTPYGKGGRYSDYGTDEDMLARAIQDTDEDDDQESRTSYI